MRNPSSLPVSGSTIFLYQRELERGLDAQEDLYSPFVLRFNIAQDSSAVVIASTSQHQVSEAPCSSNGRPSGVES